MDEAKIAVAADAAQCAICKSETQKGARLCAHCRAARHRAFAETVTRPHPAVGSVSARARELRAQRKTAKLAQRGSAAAVLAARNAAQGQAADAANDPASPLNVRTIAVVVGVLLLAGALYATYRSLAVDADGAQDTNAVDAATPTKAPPSFVSPPAAAANTAPPPAASPSAAVIGEPPAAVTTTPAEELSTSRAFAGLAAKPVVPAAGPSKPVNAKPSARSKPAVVAVPNVPAPEVAPPSAPAPVAVAPAPVREAPKPDRWQLMNTALARCGAESLLSRFACEQRVRLQYCEGAWGEVSQCTSGPVNDHGQ